MRSVSGSGAASSIALLAIVLLLAAGIGTAEAAKKDPVIDSIAFSGNDNVHPDSLLARMQTAPSGFLARRRLDHFTLGQDLVNLEVYYQNLGFLTAEARTSKLDYKEDSTHVDIAIAIKEGPRWILQSIDFEGNYRIPVSDLAGALGFGIGDPFSPARVLIGQDRILDLYVDRSFLDTRIENEVIRDDEARRAAIHYTITEGGPAYINEIAITGLVKTDTSVVRRELTLEKGKLLRVKDVARSQANLYGTGLFRSVYISPDTGSIGDSLKLVTVALVERQTGQLSFGVGYGTEDLFRVSTEARHRNLLGQNLEAGIEGTLSRRRAQVAVAFTQPWSFGLRFKINERAAFTHINEKDFASDGVTFGGSILRPIYPYWRLEGGYDWSRNVILRGPEADLQPGETYPLLVRVSRMSLVGTYETRDDLLNTYKGYYARLSAEATGAFLGGTTRFVRFNADQRYFREFGSVIMGLHLDIGVIRPQSAGIPVPVSERYFAGGQGTIRGFPEDELGPTDADGNHIGGLERAFLQAEARVPLFWRIGGVAFVDAGFIADRPPGINFKETAVGAGLGIRFRSPIGILRFDAAAPLTKNQSDGVQITFGVSQEF